MFENDYAIIGKHATYLKFLAKKNARDDTDPDNPTAARLFERYIDVYMNAAVWGLLYSRTAKRDTSSDDRARVYADAFAKERDNCVFLYRMVMLLDKTTELTSEERVDRAFRYDSLPEKAEEFKKSAPTRSEDIGSDINLMLLDMDMEDDDNPFGEDIEDDDIGSDEDDFLTRDEYEFADIDPEVFRDPTLLVKLLKSQERSSSDTISG